MKINNGNKNNTGNRRETLKKIVMIMMLGASLTSFSMFDKIKSEIKWKEEEEPRFGEVKVIIKGEPKMRKVIPGKYEIRIYELNYPESLSEKNKFYNEFNQVLKNVDKNKKYSLLLEKRFYDDIKKIEESQLSDEENLLEIPASSLDENQRQELISMSSKLNLTQYLGTDQEFLNRQVYILNQLLNKDGFDENNVYSELDKEFLVSELKEKRKNIVENFRKSNFEYFIKESYKNIDFNKFEDDSIYTFDRFFGSSFVISTLSIPLTSIFFCNALTLDAEKSFDTKSPSPTRYEAACVDFPPGAAQRSSTLSPGTIPAAIAGVIAEGSCI